MIRKRFVPVVGPETDIACRPPPGLEVVSVDVEGCELIVLRFPVPTPELPAHLSHAEREVVAGVLQGRSNADIARERGTSLRTVAVPLQSIFRKLGVGSRTELVAALLHSDGQ
jgi:DNA-binding CsgD family transcriptional regulator